VIHKKRAEPPSGKRLLAISVLRKHHNIKVKVTLRVTPITLFHTVPAQGLHKAFTSQTIKTASIQYDYWLILAAISRSS
jgi:hypothetical protein